MTDKLVTNEVLAAFCGDSNSISVVPLGRGNINDTYLVRTVSFSFVLQRINGDVFPEPLRVIENFYKVAQHLKIKGDELGAQLQAAAPILTYDRKLFFRDSKRAFWRGQSYMPHKSQRVLVDTSQAYTVGTILATFHRLIRDLEPKGLLDPLPNFHNLPSYLAEYDTVVRSKNIVQNKELSFCFAIIDRFRLQATRLEDAKHGGILNIQPIHGDPKVDNFIFDDQGKVNGLLDLDTVAMGLPHYDLGDCLRSCCNRQGEAAGIVQPINFDLGFCRALLAGYLSGPDELLSQQQQNYIFDAILLICFELGVRFFTDYLRGNLYFKVQQETDNLMRAVNQFKLTEDIAAHEQEIRAMVISLRDL